MTIGVKIKTLRKNNGMTQEKLAEYLCISYQAVSKWECGLCNPYFEEMIENSLRHYEMIVKECTDTEIYSKAVLGKIMVLRFLERIEEADWSAEFEYPDIDIKTAYQALPLFEEGQALLDYLKDEAQ